MQLEYDTLTPEQQALIKAEGIKPAEFNALAELDQQGLLVDSSASDETTGDDLQQGTGAAPAPAPAAPAPSPAAPAPAPKPEGDGDGSDEDDPDGHDSPEAQAEVKKWKPAAPVASPAPSTAPAPAPAAPAPSPAPAAPAPSPAPGAPAPAPAAAAPAVDMDSPLGIALPVAPPPPPVLVTKEDIAKRDTLKTQKDELFDKFAEGELTKAEYAEKIKPIEAELEDLSANISAQKGLEATHRAAVIQNWQGLVAHSFEVAKEAGLDYVADEKLAGELDEAVKRYGQAASLIHAKKPASWQDAWALAEAHKEVAAAHGKVFDPLKKGGAGAAPPPPAPAPAGAAPAPAPAGQRPPPDLSGMPPVTRGAPPAGDPGVSAGEFAHLEGLSPFELEKAIAKMPPDQQERYLGV